jgi:hypothetical protein
MRPVSTIRQECGHTLAANATLTAVPGILAAATVTHPYERIARKEVKHELNYRETAAEASSICLCALFSSVQCFSEVASASRAVAEIDCQKWDRLNGTNIRKRDQTHGTRHAMVWDGRDHERQATIYHSLTPLLTKVVLGKRARQHKGTIAVNWHGHMPCHQATPSLTSWCNRPKALPYKKNRHICRQHATTSCDCTRMHSSDFLCLAWPSQNG